MIVVADGERDVDGVTGEKWGLLQAFRHVPSQCVEHDGVSPGASSRFGVLNSQLFGGRYLFATANGGAVGMAVRRHQDCDCGEFLIGRLFIILCDGERNLVHRVRWISPSQLQLYMFALEDARRRGQLHTARGEYRFGISYSVWL